MRYMGSKLRLASYLVPYVMRGHKPSAWYVEPFVGGGNMMAQVPARKRLGADSCPYAIALLTAIRDGWKPPRAITKVQYEAVRANPERYSDKLVGFVGYSCSYGGKFMHGYAQGKSPRGRVRNYAEEQQAQLLTQARGLQGVELLCCDYRDLHVPQGSTIYCDPPYTDTTSYKDSFDTDTFWQWARWLVTDSRCRVFVSEYSAPEDARLLWQKSVNTTLGVVNKRTECLFVLS